MLAYNLYNPVYGRLYLFRIEHNSEKKWAIGPILGSIEDAFLTVVNSSDTPDVGADGMEWWGKEDSLPTTSTVRVAWDTVSLVGTMCTGTQHCASALPLVCLHPAHELQWPAATAGGTATMHICMPVTHWG